ncbi:formyl transferase [Actinorhabdospora filicis]|uniref:Formyl transferase n=1 Tax=Actinorhabdospora filicis TaxID=1785913 RepID=A0A9W6SNI2_9ACTN|nr:enoyl-CoA hydratase-related protein [Actinorhabdospora filicis]GLZ79122.1 formyl transferase [Actinorhabdospora filicis]
MRILLLVSAFNGLSQRVWTSLCASGHDVGIALADMGEDAIVETVEDVSPDLIVCPFLKHRVPEKVWTGWPTIIVHPGPVGDRGPSSLDHAITEGEALWGVTALQAVEEMDAGPIWATRTFPLPRGVAKSAVYNGPVADAALECVAEVVAKAADPTFRPLPQEDAPRPVPHARTRPLLKRDERMFDWSWDAGSIAVRVAAADSAPGVRTELRGMVVHAYDAHVGELLERPARPGTVVGRYEEAVAVATGDGRALWLGRLKHPRAEGGDGVKQSALRVLGDLDVPELDAPESLREVRYRRIGPVGVLTVRAHNGAMGTAHCRRVLRALDHALEQDTSVLVFKGTDEFFSNGIDLNRVEAAEDPAQEAWDNINAINDVCSALVSDTGQLTIAAYTASAGAGGAMLGLAADVALAREGVVLNPFYDIGLFGSELHTYTLPRRVGVTLAGQLLDDKQPVDAATALRLGLVDGVGPRDPAAFDEWLMDQAALYASPEHWRQTYDAKLRFLQGSRPPAYYAARELAEMAQDIFDDRSGFAAARESFVRKTPRKAAHAA